MNWLNQLFTRPQRYDGLAASIEEHLAEKIDELMDGGMSREEARYAACRAFGNATRIEERSREVWQWPRIESLWADMKFALRRLARSPGFTATAVLTLALGIGVNLGVFRVLYSVLLAPLPVSRPGELVSLHAVKSPFDGQWFVSYPAYERLRRATGTSAPVIARTGFGLGLLELQNQPPAETRFQLVSDNFFSVLGVEPAAGRLFTESEARPGQSEWPVVVRYGFALRHFGAVQVAGRHAVFNGMPVVIVGVTDERFLGTVTGYAPDLWLPLEAQSSGKAGAWFDSLGPGHAIRLSGSWLDQAGIFWLWVSARVPPGNRSATAARWTAALQPDLHLMADAAGDAHTRSATLHATVQLLSAVHGEGSLASDHSLPLIVLLALAASVFLAGCLNLANLQGARLSASQKDFSLRAALGASRWRLLRQVWVEGALLTATGGGLAIVMGRASSVLLVRWASTRDWPLDLNLQAGRSVLLLVGAALMLAALCVFSVVPAWRGIHAKLAPAGGSKWIHAAAPQSRAARRWSGAMLSAQVGLSVLLVAMAACFAKSLVDLTHLDTGMDREHVLSVQLDMVHGYASQHPNMPMLYRTMVERLEALPQVRSAAVEMCRIPSCGWNTAVDAFGNHSATELHGEEDHVGPGYFQAVGIPLLRGRDFSETDRPDTPKVAILNQAYARELFGGENPVGRWIGYEKAPHDHEFLVVGEAGDARVDGPEWPAPPVLYLSIDQNPAPIHSLQVRTRGLATSAAVQIRQTLHDFDSQLPVTKIAPLGEELDDGLTRQKLLARLTGAMAGLTLALAALGFYGVMSYRVARRRAEIGIRMAMGATRWQVQKLILQQTLVLLLAGVAPGLALTGAATRIARSFLVGTAGANWEVIGIAVVTLAAVGLAAVLIPARRAASIDPTEALRAE